MSSFASAIPSEYDAFLFAPIGGENENGMQVSVLSALARQDVDPWEEAARLAVLSREAATRKLTAWIAALPHGKSTHPDAEPIAARLIALLPRWTASDTRGEKMASDVKSVAKSWPVPRVTLYVIFLLLMLIAQWMVASHLATGLSGKAAAPTSGATSSQSLSPPDSHVKGADPVPARAGAAGP